MAVSVDNVAIISLGTQPWRREAPTLLAHCSTEGKQCSHPIYVSLTHTDRPSLAAIRRRNEQAEIHTHILFPSIDRSAAVAAVPCLFSPAMELFTPSQSVSFMNDCTFIIISTFLLPQKGDQQIRRLTCSQSDKQTNRAARSRKRG